MSSPANATVSTSLGAKVEGELLSSVMLLLLRIKVLSKRKLLPKCQIILQ